MKAINQQEAGVAKEKEQEAKPQEMKLGEYFLHVFVEDICRLDIGEGDAAAVAIQVTAFDDTKLTGKKESITNDSQVYFGDHIFFVRTFSERDALEDATMSLTVFKKGVFSSEVIGSISLNISSVYFESNHTILHRWFVLQNKETDFERPRGFVKLSVNLASDSDDKAELKPESLEASLDSAATGFELPPSVKLKFSQLSIVVLRGINLPKVEGGAGIDAYLEVSFSGMKLKTKTVSNTSPTWIEEILLPLADPSFVNTIRMQLFDYNTVLKNQLVGSLMLDVASVKKDKFKNQGWVHLYGAANKADSDVTRQMNEFPARGSLLSTS